MGAAVSDLRSLREERRRVLEEARALVDRAEAQERDLTADEKRRFEELLAKAEDLKAEIERRELVHAIAAGRGDAYADAPPRTGGLRLFDEPAGRPELRAFGEAIIRETRALSTASGATGGYIAPDEASAELVRYLSANAVALQSGVRVLRPEGHRLLVPRLDAGATAGWYGENAQISASDQSFGQLVLVPRKLAAMTIVSNELLADSSPEVGQIVAEDLARALSLELDRAFFLGSGSGNEPTGLLNVTGVQVVDVGTNGATPALDHVLDAASLIRQADAEPSVLVLHPRDLGNLVKTKDANSQYIFDGFSAEAVSRATGLRTFVTSQILTDRTKGTATNASVAFVYDPRYIFVAVRRDVTVEVDRSRYFEFDQTAIRAIMRVDIGVAWPDAVAVIDGWTA